MKKKLFKTAWANGKTYKINKVGTHIDFSKTPPEVCAPPESEEWKEKLRDIMDGHNDDGTPDWSNEEVFEVVEQTLSSQRTAVIEEITKKMQPVFDDFNAAGQAMIKDGRFIKPGTEIIENIGYMKSVLLYALSEQGKEKV